MPLDLARNFPERTTLALTSKAPECGQAKVVEQEGIKNVAFLRTSIEFIEHFFEPGEVSEIWITFPDPQMKNANKRLTGTRFLNNYRKILVPDGLIHLKTDSPFLYTYTHELTALNNLNTEFDTPNLYASGLADDILEIKTHYEQQWLQRGLTIKYICFHLPQDGELQEPDIEIEHDTYRSYGRGEIQMPQIFENKQE